MGKQTEHSAKLSCEETSYSRVNAPPLPQKLILLLNGYWLQRALSREALIFMGTAKLTLNSG